MLWFRTLSSPHSQLRHVEIRYLINRFQSVLLPVLTVDQHLIGKFQNQARHSGVGMKQLSRVFFI